MASRRWGKSARERRRCCSQSYEPGESEQTRQGRVGENEIRGVERARAGEREREREGGREGWNNPRRRATTASQEAFDGPLRFSARMSVSIGWP
jgi:hypothetical protein